MRLALNFKLFSVYERGNTTLVVVRGSEEEDLLADYVKEQRRQMIEATAQYQHLGAVVPGHSLTPIADWTEDLSFYDIVTPRQEFYVIINPGELDAMLAEFDRPGNVIHKVTPVLVETYIHVPEEFEMLEDTGYVTPEEDNWEDVESALFDPTSSSDSSEES